MAGQAGPTTDSLTERLEEAAYKFDFFQALRRMECAHPELPPIGHSQRPIHDPVRFCQEASLAFAPSTLARYEPADNGHPPRLFVNFFGLLGPHGPMPLHFTAYIRDRVRNQSDKTMARFLDIFHHRMISLYYRAWANSRQTVNFDRGDRDRFAVYIGALFGIGMDSLVHRDAAPDVAKLHYAGLLSCQAKNADGLQALLEDYFGIRTGIIQFVGRWMRLPSDCLCRLGASRETGVVGSTVIVGSSIWECQQTFRIRMGAMSYQDYERMLPGGDSQKRLIAWVRNYIGDELAWNVQLVLKAREVPKAQLGKVGKLGWTTWLGTQPHEKDADDLVLWPGAA